MMFPFQLGDFEVPAVHFQGCQLFLVLDLPLSLAKKFSGFGSWN